MVRAVLYEQDMRKSITIKNITHTNIGDLSRITVNVNGYPLWFESSDVILHPCPEGIASALLVPALHNNTDLVVNTPLCRMWLSNSNILMDIFGKWWQYPSIRIHGIDEERSAPSLRNKTALCFTGGVDSFFTLLRSKHQVDYLVFIHGYDISIDDVERMNSFQSSLQAIAQNTNTRSIIIRTNLKNHPFFATVSWEKAHGGALAAIGHLLGDVNTLLISSSFPNCYPHPWGSTHLTDPLWSSENLRIIHEGGKFWRTEKLQAIADEPLVQRYLRVCWEKRNNNLNCCRCEKCLRTMLILAQKGRLHKYTAFKEKDSIAYYLRQLPHVNEIQILVYKRFLKGGLSPELAKEVRALLKRSRKKLIVIHPVTRYLIKHIWFPLPISIRKRIKMQFKL